MKLWITLLIGTLSVAFVATGCGDKKAEPAKVGTLETYTDAKTSFSIKYPSNWIVTKTEGERLVVFSDQAASSRFVEFKEGPSAAKIDVRVAKQDDMTLEQFIEDDKIFDKSAYTQSTATLGGLPAVKLDYSFEQVDGVFKGVKYYVAQDSMITSLEIAAFGSTFDAYKTTFDQITASLIAGKKPTPKQTTTTIIDTSKKGPAAPSETMINVDGNGFSISIPDNYTPKKGNGRGVLSSTMYVGDRLDCSVQVDVIDASKQPNLDKIVSENSKIYQNSTPSKVTISGAPGYVLNYSPVANIGSRVYFTMKGDKLYRMTLNYFKPEQTVFLPALEKSVASFKFR